MNHFDTYHVEIKATYEATVMNWLSANREGIIAAYNHESLIAPCEISLKVFMTIIMNDMLAASKVAQNDCMKRGYGLEKPFDKALAHAIRANHKKFNDKFFDARWRRNNY